MRSYILAAVAAAPFMLAAASAQQATTGYVQVHGGVFLPTADDYEVDFGMGIQAGDSLNLDAGFAVGALVGARVAPGFSAEGEVTYRSAGGEVEGVEITVRDDVVTETVTVGDLDLGSVAFMANGRYEFPTQGRVTPYAVVGLGYATLDLDDDDGGVDMDGAFAYQAKIGASVPVGQGAFGAELVYFGTSDFEDSEDGTLSVEFGGLSAQATYRFGF